MTRDQIFKEYEVGAGIVGRAGPFRGQKPYVPYFWHKYLDGEAGEVSQEIIQFSVTGQDRQEFPELGQRQVFRLWLVEGKIREA